MSTNLNYKDYLSEAKKLLEIIDDKLIKKQEDYLFVVSMRALAKNDSFISQKRIFWLRDIKNRQLEN